MKAWFDVIEIEPTYPAPSKSIDEAKAQLKDVMDRHVASAIAYAEALAEYREKVKEWKDRQK
jgi:hypothetical protein